MDSRIVVVVVFVVVALVALAIAWWYAHSVKRDLDAAPPPNVGVRGVIDLAPASIEQLRLLSAEPILLKQSEEGVRIQIEQKPMLPMMAFAGKQGSATVGEAAALITQRYGVKWVVLVSPTENGQVTVQRLA